MKMYYVFFVALLFVFSPLYSQSVKQLENNENYSNSQVLNGDWEELGPSSWDVTTGWNPGVGRVNCMAVDPNNSSIIIVGTKSGVWKTIDGGENWIPLNEGKLNKDVKAIAIDPSNSNTYYFSSPYGGLNKSEDAGVTWSWVGDVDGMPAASGYIDWISYILLHPSDNSIIYVAKNGAEWIDPKPGVYRSLDGGLSWNFVLESSDIYDMEFKPTDPNIIYVGGETFQRSPDGGNSWAVIPGFSNQQNDNKMIAVSEDDPEKVYVIESDSKQFGGLFVSDNSGLSFTELDHGTNNYFGNSTSADDEEGTEVEDMSIAVNNNNVDEVHIAGNISWRSLDGGLTFTATSNINLFDASSENIGYCHQEISDMKFSDNILYASTSGGIFKTEDTSVINSSYYTDISTGLGIQMVFGLDVSQSIEPIISINSWYSGSSIYNETNSWSSWLGGRGQSGTIIDHNNNEVIYGTLTFSNNNFYDRNLYRTDDGGISNMLLPKPFSGYFSGETLAQDPVETNTIYIANNRIYKSTNKGESWSAISPVIDSSPLDIFKISPSNNQIMYASEWSQIYKSIDSGTNWTSLNTPQDILTIGVIAIHPTNPDVLAFISVDFDTHLRVFVSFNGGNTWLDYKKNLPDLEGFSLVWDDNGNDGLYIGLKNGVYYIDNTMENWSYYSNNLPTIAVNNLKINSVNGKIYAGTEGRGVWVSQKCDGCVLSADDINRESYISIYPNPTQDILNIESQQQIETVKIYSLQGQLIKESSKSSLDVSQLTAGLYFVQVTIEGKIITKKFIKE